MKKGERGVWVLVVRVVRKAKAEGLFDDEKRSACRESF
jgi:hypothetical protein